MGRGRRGRRERGRRRAGRSGGFGVVWEAVGRDERGRGDSADVYGWRPNSPSTDVKKSHVILFCAEFVLWFGLGPNFF